MGWFEAHFRKPDRKVPCGTSVIKQALFVLLIAVISRPAASQVGPRSLLAGPIDESRLVTLHGSVHPLARPANDLGPVSDSYATGRMLLLLNRPPERKAALQQFLQDVHTPGSPSFHKWLSPPQFGQQFGPADTDLKAASEWLAAHGLQVMGASKGRQFIEFSGTAGGLRAAFHTRIHRYLVNSQTHYANATEVRIPLALAALVRGVSPMNDFRAQPQLQVVGQGQIARGPRPKAPLWTAPNQYGTSSPYEFTVAPEDLATQYDLAPLYQAGIDGTGQTIAIINESNVDLSLVRNFQQLFGLNGTTPRVVIDGNDPGDLQGVDVEAYLDVEVSGAVAPKATVDLYIASAGDLIDPLALAAVRAVDDNQASVLSVSFGSCESGLGTAGNQFWESLWAQAAAQGQTVLVSSGDSGSACVSQYPAVNGLSSTAWNIAVGGTDFYYSDYASGGASASTLWNSANDAQLGSLKAPLTEQAWNDPFGFNLIPDSIARGESAGGGGGASNCATEDSQSNCVAGYPKPSWQAGAGVPADAVRDIPDVSLFASNGANLSAYAICAYAGDCALGSGASAEVTLVGGTSASAPAMAGIMALINQKYGRQGQADFVLYPLARQKPAAFHDITLGGNYYYPCGNPSGATDPNCALQWNGYYGTRLYPAGPGYDMATGLGSVDANVLVNNWNAISFTPTTTTLQFPSSSIVHGTQASITASVAAASGSGTPTGNVTVLANGAYPAGPSQTVIPLTNGTGATGFYLPGGEYQLTGSYSGDGTFAASTSQPVSLTVTPEPSNINFWMNNYSKTIAAGGSVPYNEPFQLNIEPTGVSVGPTVTQNGIATGTAVFALDSATAAVALNSVGVASWIPPLLSVGTHTASASYSGDPSFKASSSTPVTFTVSKGYPSVNMSILAPAAGARWILSPGGSLTATVTVGPLYGMSSSSSLAPFGAAPTGTVTVCLNSNFNVGGSPCTNPPYAITATLQSPSGIHSQYSSATVTFTNLATGNYMPQFTYSGDANWQAYGLFYIAYVNVQSYTPLPASTTTLTISPTSISGAQKALMTATVTGSGSSGTAPTGEVDFYDNGSFLAYSYLTAAKTGATSTTAFNIDSAELQNSGANQITAIFYGDKNYGPSTSNTATVTADQTGLGNFTLAPQASVVTVKSGSSETVGLNLAAVNNFSGTLSLTCTPSSSLFSCSVNPISTSLNGTATATVMIAATRPGVAASLGSARGRRQPGLLATGATLAFCFWFAIPLGKRRWMAIVFLLPLFSTLFLAGCGGSLKSTSSPPANGTPIGTYSIVVTGTANGIVHNAAITVAVQ